MRLISSVPPLTMGFDPGLQAGEVWAVAGPGPTSSPTWATIRSCGRAFRAGPRGWPPPPPDQLLTNPLPPVLGPADGSRANYLWSSDEGLVRLIDREDSGRSDRAFELGEVREHISRHDGTLDADQLLPHLDPAPGEAGRVRDFRRLCRGQWRVPADIGRARCPRCDTSQTVHPAKQAAPTPAQPAKS
ncbi:hypothetical protein ACFWY5_57385 [Nonomuraea sp. NPDC059007]|uniref:hypothetical protein n=1 Tax=Nonomuraea sp. NPDC059007 TaxID=3346692 RepID=UPI0036B30D4B